MQPEPLQFLLNNHFAAIADHIFDIELSHRSWCLLYKYPVSALGGTYSFMRIYCIIFEDPSHWLIFKSKTAAEIYPA